MRTGCPAYSGAKERTGLWQCQCPLTVSKRAQGRKQNRCLHGRHGSNAACLPGSLNLVVQVESTQSRTRYQAAHREWAL